MNRGDPRASLNVRQSGALTEFENFKKKFLLANKHITKLNSTLSVRVEELQAEISTLYVENLRLRASEIALATQLKKEQEKSRKILSDATSNLLKHLDFLRQSLNIPPNAPSPRSKPQPLLKARRFTSDPNTSLQLPRLSRAPNLPGIREGDEAASSPEADEDDVAYVDSSARRKAKDKLTSPRLSLARRVASPPTFPTPLHVSSVEHNSSTKRKSSRRQSKLLSVNTDVGISTRSERPGGPVHPRAVSPALGSLERRNAVLGEDDEERQVGKSINSGLGLTEELEIAVRARKERKEKKKSKVVRWGVIREDADLETLRVKERKRDEEEESSGLKDVTNPPRSHRDRRYTLDMGVSASAATSVTGINDRPDEMREVATAMVDRLLEARDEPEQVELPEEIIPVQPPTTSQMPMHRCKLPRHEPLSYDEAHYLSDEPFSYNEAHYLSNDSLNDESLSDKCLNELSCYT